MMSTQGMEWKQQSQTKYSHMVHNGTFQAFTASSTTPLSAEERREYIKRLIEEKHQREQERRK
jgi:hypothetical protein